MSNINSTILYVREQDLTSNNTFFKLIKLNLMISHRRVYFFNSDKSTLTVYYF